MLITNTKIFTWTKECEEAFEIIKKAIAKKKKIGNA
jgi:hypothetical protein